MTYDAHLGDIKKAQTRLDYIRECVMGLEQRDEYTAANDLRKNIPRLEKELEFLKKMA